MDRVMYCLTMLRLANPANLRHVEELTERVRGMIHDQGKTLADYGFSEAEMRKILARALCEAARRCFDTAITARAIDKAGHMQNGLAHLERAETCFEDAVGMSLVEFEKVMNHCGGDADQMAHI